MNIPKIPITRFMYHQSREGDVAEKYLAGFIGYLQSDDYGPYTKTGKWEGVVHVGFLTHGGRKFHEVENVLRKAAPPPGDPLDYPENLSADDLLTTPYLHGVVYGSLTMQYRTCHRDVLILSPPLRGVIPWVFFLEL